MTLPLHHGGKSRIVGLDHLTVVPFLPLGEALGRYAEGLIGMPRRGEGTGKPLALRSRQRRRLRKTRVGLSAIGMERCTQIKAPLFRVANALDEDATWAATTAAKPRITCLRSCPRAWVWLCSWVVRRLPCAARGSRRSRLFFVLSTVGGRR